MKISKETQTKLFVNSNAVGVKKLEIPKDEYTLAFEMELKKLARQS